MQTLAYPGYSAYPCMYILCVVEVEEMFSNVLHLSDDYHAAGNLISTIRCESYGPTSARP